MYAIIEDGARQYRVTEGQIVRVDYRAVEGKEPAKAHLDGRAAGANTDTRGRHQRDV